MRNLAPRCLIGRLGAGQSTHLARPKRVVEELGGIGFMTGAQ